MVNHPNLAAFIAPPAPPDGISSSFMPPWPVRRGPSPEIARPEYSRASMPVYGASPQRRSPSPTPSPHTPVALRQPSPAPSGRGPIGSPQYSGHAGDHVGGAIGGAMDPWPLEQARSLSPTSPSFSPMGPTVLSRPMTERQCKDWNGQNRRDVLGFPNVATPQKPVRPPFVFAPYKRYPTTYIDAFTAPRRPRTHTRTLSSQLRKNDGFFGMPPQPRPRPDKFPMITSRFTKDLPRKMELKKGERIVLRNTRLCYHENKYTYHRCDHSFKIAREVRQAEVERRQLMRLRRIDEIGDHRPLSQWLYGLKNREKSRYEALQAIEESEHYLLELEKLEDPMAAERERAVWRIDVARQRLRIADEMDEIDLSLDMEDDANDDGDEERGRSRFERPPVDKRFITIDSVNGFDRQTGYRRLNVDDDRTNRVMPIPKDIAEARQNQIQSASPSEERHKRNNDDDQFDSPAARPRNPETRQNSRPKKVEDEPYARGFTGVTDSPKQPARSSPSPRPKDTTGPGTSDIRNLRTANVKHEENIATKPMAGARQAAGTTHPKERVSHLLRKLMSSDTMSDDTPPGRYEAGQRTLKEGAQSRPHGARELTGSEDSEQSLLFAYSSQNEDREERHETAGGVRPRTGSSSTRNSTIKELLNIIERGKREENVHSRTRSR
eukprot:GEMP01015654.1.p1 GENE.GEMP01015654.1~~GEMP01015654.1.p1  ORF type:complete len:665 (+),score=143.42 GEMP01015654.1:163-2157(+)